MIYVFNRLRIWKKLEKILKIKGFVNIHNWKGTNYSSAKDD